MSTMIYAFHSMLNLVYRDIESNAIIILDHWTIDKNHMLADCLAD